MKFKLEQVLTLHPILFSLFPVLWIITLNFDEIIFLDAMFSLLIILGITILSWLFLNLFFKNKLKSGLFTSLGLILFFSYGYFINTTSQIGINVNTLPFSHHTYAVPIYFLILLIGIFTIIRIKKHLRNVTILTNIVAIVLISMILTNVVSYSFETYDDDYVDNPLNYKILNESQIKYKPNIYYIIVDEYTSDEILSEIYNYDNTDFLSKLTQRGFYIPSDAYTNYVTSSLAITANLNMQYLDPETSTPSLNGENVFFNHNQIMQILKSLNYTIVNIGLEYGYPEIADYQLCPPSMFVNQFHTTLIDGSLWQPFSKFFVTAGDPQRDRVNCKFSELSNLENSFNSPFFVFSHIMSPHPPYLFGPNGESFNPEFLSIGAASWGDKSGYVNQVQYVNKKIIETIDKILESNSQAVIIIQGDHGTPTQLGGGGLRWTNVNDDSIIERMSIFNAYYFPNLDSEIIYDGITPVNSLRLVVNNYLNGDYELLEDKLYFSTYGDMLNFTDVTQLIQNP